MSALKPGDHVCCFYTTETEHQAVVTPYLRHGLERAQKVLYVSDSHSKETILGYLRDSGVDPGPYLERGQLTVLSVHDVAARQRHSGPHGAVDWLRAEMEQAKREGYSELWATGEMTWVLWKLPNPDRLAEYEAQLNQFIPNSSCVCLCQYDRRRFSPQALMNALRAHPLVAIGPGVYDNAAILKEAPAGLTTP